MAAERPTFVCAAVCAPVLNPLDWMCHTARPAYTLCRHEFAFNRSPSGGGAHRVVAGFCNLLLWRLLDAEGPGFVLARIWRTDGVDHSGARCAAASCGFVARDQPAVVSFASSSFCSRE